MALALPAPTAEETRHGAYERLARLVRALAAPARLKLIQSLAQAPRTVEALATLTGESVANTSQHLQRLARAGLVSAARQGTSRMYRLAGPQVAALWERLQDVGEELEPALAVAQDVLTDRRVHAPLAVPRVLQAVRARRGVLLDVRETVEAEATPVAGARHIPLAALGARLGTLPRGKPIYVFCRGRYCHLATAAVRQLRRAGFEAYRLRDSAFKLNVVASREEA